MNAGMAMCALAAETNDPACWVRSGTLQATLSPDGQITNLQIGEEAFSVLGETIVDGCRTEGEVQRRALPDGGWEFRRSLVHEPGGTTNQAAAQRCELIERVRPGSGSIRWELEIGCGDESPWSTPITTRLKCPVSPGSQFWTPWGVGNVAAWVTPTNASRATSNNKPIGAAAHGIRLLGLR
jgi:hypothetical protein